MRRRYVSERELNQVMKLKHGGASWLRIQNETGIPRRTAQKACEEWEGTKSSEELKRARMVIAEEEFRKHMENLTSLAQALVDLFYVPMPADRIKDGEGVFDNLWRQDIRQGRKTVIGEKEERRVVRQNKMLYVALQEHTGEVVRWQALEEWKQAFTDYFEHCGAIQKEVRNIIANMLKQRAELKDRIEAMSDGKEIVESMVRGVVETLWHGIRGGGANLENIHIQAKSLDRGVTEISFGKEASRTAINIRDKDLGDEIAGFCRVVANNICCGKKSYLLLEIADDMGKMEKDAGELERRLDELILRPAILRTRCYLCPV